VQYAKKQKKGFILMKKSTFKKFVAFALVVMMLASTCVINIASAANLTITVADDSTTSVYTSGSADGSALTDGVKTGSYTSDSVSRMGSSGYTNFALSFDAAETFDTIKVYSFDNGSSFGYPSTADKYVVTVDGAAVDFTFETDATDATYPIAVLKLASAVTTSSAVVTVYNQKYLLGIFEIEVANSGDSSDDETSEDVTSEDVTSEDVTSEDVTSEDVTSEDVTSEDATTEDATTEDATTEDATTEDATSDDATSDDTTSEEPAAPVEVNYAAGKKYTVQSSNEDGVPVYCGSNIDEGNFLTDGVLKGKMAGFGQVEYQGSAIAHTITLNLGTKRTDIDKIVFAGSRIDGNRQFANVTIEVSTNGKTFKKVDAVRTEVALEEAPLFDVVFDFESDVTAKYVRLTCANTNYVFSTSEIQVIGYGAEAGGEVNPGENENPGDAGFAVVALVAMISLAGAVIVSKKRFN
jgi:hypothetical protein